jgi:nickel-type superoxide dismutase maturation protease
MRRFVPVGAAAALAVVLWRWRPFRVEIQGNSMAPALQPGDWAIATRARRLAPGDVVVLAHPLKPELELVKRVLGGPGDHALQEGRPLGPDQWFVVGDNHETSTDSRSFGPVSRRAITGRVRLVYWPPRRMGKVGPSIPTPRA